MNRMRIQTRILAMLALLLAVSTQAQLTDQQIVNNAFPASLDQGDGLRFSRFIIVDLNHNGQPLLVAVYTNRAAGAIRVLDRAGQVLAAPNVPGMRGFAASVRAVDLDGDGTPEIIAEFARGFAPENPDSWVFRWAGDGLRLISPTCSVGTLPLTCLGYVSVIDLNGDGKLSLLNWPALSRDSDTGRAIVGGDWTLYTLNNGMFQQTPERFLFARQFRGEKGEPFTSQRNFSATPGAAVLRVITGTKLEASTSGHVTLNGAEVLGPADFKRKQHVYEVPVTLASQNNLTVRLEGKPGSNITILIRATDTAVSGVN